MPQAVAAEWWIIMIKVTRMNREIFYINPDLIELLEETPDTLITTTTGKKLIVKESAEQIIDEMVGFKHKVLQGIPNINNT